MAAQPIEEVRRIATELAEIYAQSWARIIAEQNAIVDDPSKFRRRARLAEVERRILAELATLNGHAARYIEKNWPALYQRGAEMTAAALDAQFAWTLPHREALEYLASRTFEELLAATTFTAESTKRFLRELSRSELLDKFVAGRTAIQTGREITRFASEHGIHSVVYRNGARFPLDAYAEMVARTESAMAHASGLINQGQQLDVRFYELVDGTGCGLDGHDQAPAANGMIVSAREYAAHPISHPNCVRSAIPRPDIVNAKDAGRSPSLRSEESVVDQTAFELFQNAQGLTASGRVRRGSTVRERATRRAARRDPEAVFNRFVDQARMSRRSGRARPRTSRAPRPARTPALRGNR